MVTVVTESGASDVSGAIADGEDLWVTRAEVESTIGWTLKPEGLCRGDVCVPLPDANSDRHINDGGVNLSAWWKLMDRPVLHDAAGDTWMLGASAYERANALQSLAAPDFTLPDLEGALHALSDYRGKRVFLTTWSSW